MIKIPILLGKIRRIFIVGSLAEFLIEYQLNNHRRQHCVREPLAVDGRNGVRGPCATENAEQATVSALEHV